jgi:hypothetical protein
MPLGQSQCKVDLAVLISDRRLLRNVDLSPLGIEPLMLAGPTTSRLDPAKPGTQ